MNYISGYGPNEPKLMILGECPTIQDVQAGKPFSGSEGRELDTILRQVGINKHNCWLSTVSKFHVPLSTNEKIPFYKRAELAGVDLKEQTSDLQNEINSINPNCILALGSTALYALYGSNKIQDYRGSILLGMGKKFVASYNPGELIRHKNVEFIGGWNRFIIALDFQRAKEESESPDIIYPHRILQVCRNSAHFLEFLERHKNATEVAIDIEAFQCIPSCVGLSFDGIEGFTIPLWNHAGISNIPDGELAILWILLDKVLRNPQFKKIGQNFKYDQDKILRLGFIIDKLTNDTMLKAYALNPELPVNLAFLTSLYTREPFYKNEGMYEGSQHDLQIGCARDACVTFEISSKQETELIEIGQRDFYYNFLMQLHDLYLHIEGEGFRVDEQARERLLEKYIAWSEENNYKLFKLLGTTINTASPKQVSTLLYNQLGLKGAGKGTGEEPLTQMINSPKTSEMAKEVMTLILADRSVKKTIGTYLMALPDYDGRMRTSYFLCLNTGRTATSKQEPPIRPSVKIDNKDKYLGIAFQTITKHGDIGGDVRTMYVVDDGEVFLQADSSQAEARVVFLLAKDEQALEDIDKHDYHALTASWFFGGNESDYSKKVLGYESPIRFAGKTLRHAGHLGAGKKRAATELNTQARKHRIPIQLTEGQADNALKIFHRKQPAIQQVFHTEVIHQINTTRTLIAPLPYGINSSVGGRRIFFEKWSEELNRQALSYLPQRAVSDSTKAAAIRIKRRAPWVRIIVEAHDALLVSVKEELKHETALILKEEMERPISFKNCSLPRRDLVIPCDVEFGYNYKDLNKFKFMVPEDDMSLLQK